jgi:hypothetical protein
MFMVKKYSTAADENQMETAIFPPRNRGHSLKKESSRNRGMEKHGGVEAAHGVVFVSGPWQKKTP